MVFDSNINLLKGQATIAAYSIVILVGFGYILSLYIRKSFYFLGRFLLLFR